MSPAREHGAGAYASYASSTTDPRLALRSYLDLLFERCLGSELIEVRFRRGAGGMGQVFAPTRRRRTLERKLLELARSTDVYVGAAPRSERYGGRGAVKRGFALWVDCDSQAAVDALAAVEPAPALVVASGSATNAHAYWPLRRAVEPARLELANRRLAHALGADMLCSEPARILRPPGTLNHKHREPTAVRTLLLERTRFELDDVIAGLADPPTAAPAPAAGSRRAGEGDPLLAIPAEEYVARLTGQALGRDRKVRCPMHEDSTPSLHVYGGKRGWTCFGCKRGGSIFDLASAVYGFPTRGAGFLELRRQLERDFGLEAGST